MKAKLCLIIFSFLSLNTLFAQNDAASGDKALFIYEESNSSIDPWIIRFGKEFKEKGIKIKMVPASEIGKDNIDISQYKIIVIHGAVLAFTMKEPVRDWLKTKPDLTGKNIHLLITAGGIFLEKYSDQLNVLLLKNNANVVDVVSGATGKLSDDEKNIMTKDFVGKID